MPLNALTASTGLKLGPLVLETLVKHYYERLKTAHGTSATTSSDGVIHDEKHGGSALSDNLRQEELLYDQAFILSKNFVLTASRHTVEEMQRFTKIGPPSPPWVKVLHVLIPMSCCDKAAEHLIDTLGGESAAKEIVGGTKWWQIRGVDGVEAEWIVAKKDWKEAKKRAKSKERRDQSRERRGKEREKSPQRFTTTDSTPAGDTPELDYTPDMDEQRCILYFHGGAYYFGSVDQERYSIQRFARKINGRAFAIHYRLSPQYPFPCAIQDALAAYLYLIRPPPEAKHKPVKPQHVIIMGNSAGAGLSLALLQVIRDSGLPQCSGGVLVSPWCDASHSFPSIPKNMETDVLPNYCLAMHKPSTLWPLPADAGSDTVRQTIRSRLRRVTEDQGRLKSFLGSRGRASPPKDETMTSEHVVDAGTLGTSTSAVPSVVEGQNRRVVLKLDSGETLNVDTQIHCYAPNNLLPHPLISHCGAYLGGLPPLLITAGDQEVLRDEVIYTAHRAADPSRFPIPAAARRLYPKMADIEARHPTPTKVHLQVYDGCAHILPILFAFTTPAKYCFRAIASFCRFATEMEFPSPGPGIGKADKGKRHSDKRKSKEKTITEKQEGSKGESQGEKDKVERDDAKAGAVGKVGVVDNGSSPFGEDRVDEVRMVDQQLKAETEDDIEGSRQRHPGDYPPIYVGGFVGTNLIRERVSIQGVIRPLEPEAELPSFQLKDDLVGAATEIPLRQYIQAKAEYQVKFSSTYKSVIKERERNLRLAHEEDDRSLGHLESYLQKVTERSDSGQNVLDSPRLQKITADSWNWSWAMDEDENPPLSSLVSRRDTPEALQLAMIAEIMPENTPGGNNLWRCLLPCLTATPDEVKLSAEREHQKLEVGGDGELDKGVGVIGA